MNPSHSLKKSGLNWEASVSTKSKLAIYLIPAAFGSMAIAIFLCTQAQRGPWLTGQFTLGVSCLLWFMCLTEFAREAVFKSQGLNQLGGHLASFFCLVPFNQWKEMNAGETPKAIPLNDAYFTPVNVIAYSTKNFWNIKRLFGLFPEKAMRKRFICSMLVMNLFFLVVTPAIPGFWKNFGLGYFIFLILVERLLRSGKLTLVSVSGKR